MSYQERSISFVDFKTQTEKKGIKLPSNLPAKVMSIKDKLGNPRVLDDLEIVLTGETPIVQPSIEGLSNDTYVRLDLSKQEEFLNRVLPSNIRKSVVYREVSDWRSIAKPFGIFSIVNFPAIDNNKFEKLTKHNEIMNRARLVDKGLKDSDLELY